MLWAMSTQLSHITEYLDTTLIGIDVAEGEWKHLHKLFEGAGNTRRPIS